jgi:hypothetical protein
MDQSQATTGHRIREHWGANEQGEQPGKGWNDEAEHCQGAFNPFRHGADAATGRAAAPGV